MLKKTILATSLIAASLMGAEKINGAGATFPAPLYYQWAYMYQAETKNQVNYQSIGSGGGIKQIQQRTVDFGASDKPLSPAELKQSNLLQFPAVVGSIQIVYNLDGIGANQLKLSNDVAADIYLGKITMWNDPRIAKDNPGLALPAKRITVVHRSDGSGTTFNFVYWLSQISKEWASKVGYGTSVNWPTGIGGKGNEGVTNIVKQTPGSIGYVEYAYVKQHNLKPAVLQSKEGTWVEASTASIKAAAANAKWTKQDHFHEILALQPGKNTYPIVAGTFILLPKEKPERNKKVVKFFNFAFDKGDAAAEKLGYIPLPTEAVSLIRSYFKDNGLQ
ncbi:MAG: phosphate ABC transporter substrate-binding protein PstS [Campylobacterales bacterium]